MIRRCLFLFLVLCQPAFAQKALASASLTGGGEGGGAVSTEAELIQEQAAICAAFARVMEYSGLLEEIRGRLWRERRFYAGAVLHQSITEESGNEPTNAALDGLINQYSGWMIGLFSATPGVADTEEIEERDKLKDYVSTLCTPLFINADKAIALLHPEIFEAEGITPPEGAHAAEVPDGNRDNASIDNENIDKLIDENITLRAKVAVLEEDLTNTAQALDEAQKTAEATAEEVVKPAPDISTTAPDISPATRGDSPPLTPETSSENTPETPPKDPPQSASENTSESTPETPPPRAAGRMQIQLASYSSMKAAERDVAILHQEIPPPFAHIRFSITTSRLASGKVVYRIVSAPLVMETARSLCTHFWSLQYGCIIRMIDTP